MASSMSTATSPSAALPFILSLMAGMSTCIGSAVVFLARSDRGRPPLSDAHLAFSLALAGSVMVTVSFVSILPESFADETFDGYALLPLLSMAFLERCMSFLVGCGLYMLLAKCVFPEPVDILGFQDIGADMTSSLAHAESAKTPSKTPLAVKRTRNFPRDANHDESSSTSKLAVPTVDIFSQENEIHAHSSYEVDHDDKKASTSRMMALFSGADIAQPQSRRAWRVAMLLFVSLAFHNFPEGLAVAASALHSPKLGITTSIAIALHNIPEGIAIAIPCLAARPDAPCLAFALASVSGLTEPLGAAVALIFLKRDGENGLPDTDVTPFGNMKNVLAFVAGMMIMVACRELFPEALRYSRQGLRAFVCGTISGVFVMIFSDWILGQ